MNHERAQTLMSDYLDAELDATTRRLFEAHLEGCEACAAELEALRATLRALGSLPPVAPPPDLLKGVAKKLGGRGKSPFDFSFGLDRKIPFEGISIILIGILLAFYVLLVMLPKEKPGAVAVPQTRSRPDAGLREAGPTRASPGEPGRRSQPPETTLPEDRLLLPPGSGRRRHRSP